MRIFQMPRRSGKTYELITLSARKGGVIICANQQRKEMIQMMAYDRKLEIPEPMIFSDILNRKHYGRHVELLIDDVDEFLQEVVGYQFPITYCTYTPS